MLNKLSLSLLLLSATLMTGCGSETGPQRFGVSGFVTVDDQPLKNGTINFVPMEITATESPSSTGYIIDGQFKIVEKVGPVAGSQKVTITAEEEVIENGEVVNANLIATYQTTAEIDTENSAGLDFALTRNDSVKE